MHFGCPEAASSSISSINRYQELESGFTIRRFLVFIGDRMKYLRRIYADDVEAQLWPHLIAKASPIPMSWLRN